MQVQIDPAELNPSEMVCSGWIHAFGFYEPRWNVMRHYGSDWSRAVILAKRRYEGVCQVFGRMIAGQLRSRLGNDRNWTVTHVPAESSDQEWLFEGLDRCATEMLAACIWRELSRVMEVSLESLLIQVRSKAKKQHQCSDTVERIANVQDLYSLVPGKQVNDRHILLVDDVITSGATMNECARVLREGGAREIIGVALARTARAKGEHIETSLKP